MNHDFHIDPMMPEEAQIAIDWAAKEGWNPGVHDAAIFYRANPTGMFIGKWGDEPVAVASSVIYDEHFAFFGLLIVKKEFRDRGYGLAITKKRLNYIGNRNAGLDGVVDMQAAYAKNGFKYAHRNLRFHLVGEKDEAAAKNEKIVSLNQWPFKRIFDYDSLHFPAMRPAFLSAWINQNDALAVGYIDDQTLCGYGVIRQCEKGYKIGPLFADDEMIAESLFAHLCHYGSGKDIYFDIPELNSTAMTMVKRHHMDFVFETARMYLQNQPDLPMSHIYGLTTFEFG